MSKNISKLSGRKGLKDNLFKRMISTTKKSDSFNIYCGENRILK